MCDNVNDLERQAVGFSSNTKSFRSYKLTYEFDIQANEADSSFDVAKCLNCGVFVLMAIEIFYNKIVVSPQQTC
jgi:hypothetical protein